MRGCWACLLFLALLPGSLDLTAATVQAGVVLEWRPSGQAVAVDGTVDIALFARSDSAEIETIFTIEMILAWDPARLALLGNVDPCVADPCSPNTFNWPSSGFPLNNIDGLNDTFADGRAVYLAIGEFDPNAAVATPGGLWVTTMRFLALAAGSAELRMEATFAEGASRTTVVRGDGNELFVSLGPDAQVSVLDCPVPSVAAVGCRYLHITPGLSMSAVALRVEGDSDNDDVSCMALFVQGDGTLDTLPFSQAPSEWGTVGVSDTQILPSTAYRVRSVCGLDEGLDLSSDPPVEVSTWRWGDVDDNGVVDFLDLSLVLNGADGLFSEGIILENLDLAPCRPDGFIDQADIDAAIDALSGRLFPCDSPCPAPWDLEDYTAFANCMAGPDAGRDAGCDPFDDDGDNDVDLSDFRLFQTLFAPP